MFEYETKLAFLSQEIERQNNQYKVKMTELENTKNQYSLKFNTFQGPRTRGITLRLGEGRSRTQKPTKYCLNEDQGGCRLEGPNRETPRSNSQIGRHQGIPKSVMCSTSTRTRLPFSQVRSKDNQRSTQIFRAKTPKTRRSPSSFKMNSIRHHRAQRTPPE